MVKPLRTIIVDDEPLARSLLESYLASIPEVEVVAQCQNGRQAIETTNDLHPDLIFLDIQMPGMNGFDVIMRLQSDSMPMFVFVTAFQQYALDAFDVNAVDYVLKPLDEERINRAVTRAQERLEERKQAETKHQVIGAIEEMARKVAVSGSLNEDPEESAQMLRKLAIKDRDSITLLEQANIDWVDAAGDYMCIHSEGETHILRSTMKDLLKELDPNIFKRVHRSTIVNLDKVQKIIPHTKGEYFLLLGEQDKIKVSRNYREVIKSFIDQRH